MARIDSTGIFRRDLTFFVGELERIFRQAWGDDLNVDPETPQGQFIGLVALAFDELDAGVVNLANAQNLQTATGYQLDDHGSLLNNRRREGAESTAVVRFVGSEDTEIPVGTRLQTGSGDIFLTTEYAIIPNTGSVNVNCESERAATIIAPAGTITSLVDVIVGIDSVTNQSDAIVGFEREGDAFYRNRLETQSMRNATTFAEAVASSVSEVENVGRLRVLSNDGNDDLVVANVMVPAHSVRVIAEGGIGSEIAVAIRDAKTGGIPTVGEESVNLNDVPSISANDYHFDILKKVGLSIDLDIDLTSAFPSDGVSQIRNELVAWVNNLDIGEAINLGRVYEALNLTPGYFVESISINSEYYADILEDIEVVTDDHIEGGSLDTPDAVWHSSQVVLSNPTVTQDHTVWFRRNSSNDGNSRFAYWDSSSSNSVDITSDEQLWNDDVTWAGVGSNYGANGSFADKIALRNHIRSNFDTFVARYDAGRTLVAYYDVGETGLRIVEWSIVTSERDPEMGSKPTFTELSIRTPFADELFILDISNIVITASS